MNNNSVNQNLPQHTIKQFKDGTIIEIWRQKQSEAGAVLHRPDGPAYIRWEKGVNVQTVWALNGQFHHSTEPAIILQSLTDPDGCLKEWWFHGQRHRDHGPALIHQRTEQSGLLVHEEWWSNHQRHRNNGPAIIDKLVQGDQEKILEEAWYHHGRLHRMEGPAITVYQPTGWRQSWYQDDLLMKEEKIVSG